MTAPVESGNPEPPSECDSETRNYSGHGLNAAWSLRQILDMLSYCRDNAAFDEWTPDKVIRSLVTLFTAHNPDGQPRDVEENPLPGEPESRENEKTRHSPEGEVEQDEQRFVPNSSLAEPESVVSPPTVSTSGPTEPVLMVNGAQAFRWTGQHYEPVRASECAPASLDDRVEKLEWRFVGSYWVADAPLNPRDDQDWQDWYIEPFGTGEEVMLQPPTTIICASIDAAKSLAERLQAVLSSPTSVGGGE